MNAVTHRGPVPARAVATPRSIAQILSGSEQTLLRAWRLSDEIISEFPEWVRTTYLSERVPNANRMRHPGPQGAQDRAYAQDVLDKLPPACRLLELSAAIADLEAAQPEPAKVRLLIAVMVDGFPNARPHNPEAYLEGLVHESASAGFSTPIVAKACRTIAQTSTFPPSIAEFLKACQDADSGAPSPRLANKAAELRLQIERDLDEAEQLGPRNVDDEWRAAMKLFTDRGFWAQHQLGIRPGQAGCSVPPSILAEYGFHSTESDGDEIPF